MNHYGEETTRMIEQKARKSCKKLSWKTIVRRKQTLKVYGCGYNGYSQLGTEDIKEQNVIEWKELQWPKELRMKMKKLRGSGYHLISLTGKRKEKQQQNPPQKQHRNNRNKKNHKQKKKN